FKESSPVWSRDGRWILYTTDRRPAPWFGQPVEDVEIRAISPELGAPSDGADTVIVADIAGPLGPFAEGPDGQFLAIGGIRPTPTRSYDQNTLLHFKGAWPLTLARDLAVGLDAAVGEAISSDQHPPRGGGDLPLGFIEQGNAAVFVYAKHGASQLARVDLASGAVEALTPANHEVIHGDVSADGRRVALTLGALTTPGDLYVQDFATRALTRLFGPNDAALEEARLGAVEEVWFPSFDGMQIQGWVVKPADFDPMRQYPLVLEIHGGPHAAYGIGFSHEFRVLAAAGYVVLYVNPRGSTSYGQEFANCIQYAYPGHDYDDLMAGVDHMVATGYIDEKRMGVTGGSGGGLLTNWIITKTDRFRAAITQRCVSDWGSMWYSSDFAMFNAAWFRKAPYEDPNEFAERSPATFLDRVNTPLMVIHSEEDWRTPIAQGEIMFRGLLKQGKPAVMIRFPGESHELSRSGAPSRRVQNQQHIRRWFDHFLQGKPAPEYGV
ncbi:MAG: S9 family peptidase, partial [Candidatus Eisenbacteria bacterium]